MNMLSLMPRRLRAAALLHAVAVMLALTSCDTVLQYPDEPAVDPTLVSTIIELLTDFTPVTDPLIATYADTRAGNYDVRYQIEIYATSGSDAGRCVARHVATESTLPQADVSHKARFDLHAGQYDVYAWIDFVPIGTTADYHYITTDLRAVHIADPNVCGLDTKDAFAGKTTLDLSDARYAENFFSKAAATITMERPFGKFKIVTTDVKKFIESYKPNATYSDAVPATTKLRYSGYFPCCYNQDTRLAHVEFFRLGVNHTADVIAESETQAALTYDYVLVCNDNTYVTADIEVSNAAGERLKTTRGIRIPIQRNKLTIVSGEFLTIDYTDSGGTGIDDGFDGEFVITVPD